METQTNSGASGWKENKLFIAIEATLIALYIVVQNLYHILPVSEVPYLFLFAWLMLRLRGLKWSSIGLKKPVSWLHTILLGLATAIFLQLLSEFVTEPLITRFTHKPTDLSEFKPLVGNTTLLIVYFVVIWTLAAFGEELVYRGYTMNRMADVGNRTSSAWLISLLLVSVLFGIGHFYQGITGMIDSGISSLIFGSIYLYTGRNLWASILAHGFSDTIGLLIIYFDLVKI
jgi:hypothetical protein